MGPHVAVLTWYTGRCYSLNALFPAKHKFSMKVTKKKREIICLRARNETVINTKRKKENKTVISGADIDDKIK